MSKFQIILTAVFVLFIAIGVAVFATYKGSGSVATLPTITVWGTLPEGTVGQFLQIINRTQPTPITMNYREIRESDFNKTFIETLARGSGPDAIIIPQDMLYKQEDKLTPIPYTTLPERNFKDVFIRQAEQYLSPAGVLAVPFTIDPLVMYWNRDIFTNAGISSYPRFWDEIEGGVSKITLRDNNANVRRSIVALGEFQNVTHARELFGTLLMQAGNPVTKHDGNTAAIESALGRATNFSGTPSTQAALSFFTQFSNPSDPAYSWNRSLPSSKSSFLSGKLATYFGYASELADIRAKNPNIDFDVAPMPQARKGTKRLTYGRMYGWSIVRSSQIPGPTYNVILALTSTDALKTWAELNYLPSVRRDVIAQGSTDPYIASFNDSALIADGWLDPDASQTGSILQELVESVTSGRSLPYQAIDTANDRLNLLIQSI